VTAKFNIGNVTGGEGGHIVIGDHAVINAQVGELQQNVKQIEKTLADLQAEMAKPEPDRNRLQKLLATLTAGAGSVTALVDGVEKVRQALGIGQ
jgi:hypothetical protein